jgi:hypothetical protein
MSTPSISRAAWNQNLGSKYIRRKLKRAARDKEDSKIGKHGNGLCIFWFSTPGDVESEVGLYTAGADIQKSKSTHSYFIYIAKPPMRRPGPKFPAS